MHTFVERCHYFRNNNPTDIKTQHVLHMVGTRVHAKFRRRKTQRLGGDMPQKK